MRGGGAVVVIMFLLVGANVICRESSKTLAEAEDGCLSRVPVVRDYPTIKLSLLAGLTEEVYGEFIALLREMVGSSAEVWSLPVLRNSGSVPLAERFVLVDITNYGGLTVTLAIDVTNVYVVGYRAGNEVFFLTPDNNDTRDAIPSLFPELTDNQRKTLPFTGAYGALQQAAGTNRDKISLGVRPLQESVWAMNVYAQRPTPLVLQGVARGLLVCIQMVSEAARFRYIEFEMRSRIRRNVESEPDGSVIRLETSWGTLSEAIQRSNEDGVFQTPVDLQRRNYSLFRVFGARAVIPIISLLLFYCDPAAPRPKAVITNSSSIRRLLTVTSEASDDDDPSCPSRVQSTLRILGSGGLCVDVRDGDYSNGNPIQLWPCSKPHVDDQRQIWTFGGDDTLRSNGKCLASYGYAAGNYIMIYDCDPRVDAFIWRSWPNGTITSASGLVLSVDSSSPGTTLTVRDNAYTTGQSWLPTNTTDPPLHKISGLSGLCLHANTDGYPYVVLLDCAQASWWVLYPDSSIRPAATEGGSDCLAASGPSADQSIRIAGCNPNSYLQRWLFASDGTITSFSTQLVVDVRGGSSAVSGAHIFLNEPAGTATQEWLALL